MFFATYLQHLMFLSQMFAFVWLLGYWVRTVVHIAFQKHQPFSSQLHQKPLTTDWHVMQNEIQMQPVKIRQKIHNFVN